MKLIKWNTVENIEAYTITKELGDMSYNNEDKQLILNNRKQLAKLLKTDLDNITIRGRKGGSTVSVAIVNALMYMVVDR